MRRVVGVLWHPRQTMAAVVRDPSFITVWMVVLLIVAACGVSILSTAVGRQALVDERVRTTEMIGGDVDDAVYAAWLADPPISAYLTSGGRVLVTPLATLIVALALMGVAAMDRTPVSFVVALAIVVHATTVLALQQVVAVPAQLVRESLGSPTSLATLMPMVEDGTWLAGVLGSIDVFGIWWVVLMAVGLAAATGRSTVHWLVRLSAAYVAIAAVVAGAVAVLST
jgi:Yip1 domain